MRYIVDHDMHMHSKLSLCSNNPAQTTDALLAHGEKHGFSLLCLTDHYWDDTIPGATGFYRPQNYDHVAESLPLPQSDKVKFLFGVESDMDMNYNLGIPPERFDCFDFVIIPTTHLHMGGFTCLGTETPEERGKLWVDRFDALLGMDLPFYKMGVAHLTSACIAGDKTMDALRSIPDAEKHRLFEKAAKVGIGIELNFNSLKMSDEDLAVVLPFYRIAKEHGCKFYFGSDTHHPEGREHTRENFENIVDLLGLEESDKFVIGAK